MGKSHIVQSPVQPDLHLHVEDREISMYSNVNITSKGVKQRHMNSTANRPNTLKMLEQKIEKGAPPEISQDEKPVGETTVAFSGIVTAGTGTLDTPPKQFSTHGHNNTISRIPKLKMDGIIRPTSTKNEGVSPGHVSTQSTFSRAASELTSEAPPKKTSCNVYPSGALVLSPRTAFDDISVSSCDSGSVVSSSSMCRRSKSDSNL